jgi:hypothetical protein
MSLIPVSGLTVRMPFLFNMKTGPGSQICEGCIVRSLFSSPGEAIFQYGNELVRQNLNTGNRTSLAKPGSGRILDAALSPDDGFVALVLGKHSGGNAIYVVPADGIPIPEPEWIPIADEDFLLDSPRWSADCSLLYYISERDGSPCIWAQRLHPQTRRPDGNAIEVFHERLARYAIAGPKRWRVISAARDRLIALRCEATGNIYLTTLENR